MGTSELIDNPEKRIDWHAYRNDRRQPGWACLYALRDPLTGRIRYIGKTKMNPSTRLNGHCSCARASKSWQNGSRRARWIKSLLDQGLRPVIVILGYVPFEDWAIWEKRLIGWFIAGGCDLLNSDKGGGGL
jgi:hypothetical protein